ncbi:MAG: hypothetical protein AAF721_15525 [Myxococcota bacterium]
MIDSDIIPLYSADEFAAVAIHSFREGTVPASHVQVFGLGFPVALDYESEQFRRFRLPGHVFPLNVVFNPAGEVVHLGTDLDEAAAAIAAELE